MTPLERWAIIFLLLVMVVAWNTIAGCAQIPKCDIFQYQVAQDGSGRVFYILDEENAVKMIHLVEGLSNQTCRLDK